MTKRSFEFLDGKSAKFWEIVLDGSSHTVRYGKLGATGTASPWAGSKVLSNCGSVTHVSALGLYPASLPGRAVHCGWPWIWAGLSCCRAAKSIYRLQ